MTLEQVLVAGHLATPVVASIAAPGLCRATERYAVNTPRRLAAFLAQCAHESCGFAKTEENLHYSATRLLEVFPTRFTRLTAREFAGQPEKIANIIYGSRLGNGPPQSGDGWKYRGRGYIQLTGRENYLRFGSAIHEDIVNEPDRVADPELAALSAAWFWANAGCNELADNAYFVDITRRINGGLNGIAARQQLYKQACQALGI